MYQYVCDLADAHRPATRANSLLQAVGFAKGVIGLDNTELVLSSRRVRGAAYRNFGRKRVLRKRSALTKVMLSHFEKGCLRGSKKKRILCGSGCVLGHTRSRYSLLRRTKKEPRVEVLPQASNAAEAGFVEWEIPGQDTKQGNRAAKRRRLMPVVGHVFGVEGTNWVAGYVQARQDCGLVP